MSEPYVQVSLEDDVLDPWLALSAFTNAVPQAGALASFVGLCRGTNDDCAALEGLELDYYPGFTQSQMKARAVAEVDRFALLGCLILHRTGFVPVGQPIVVVGCASFHRASAHNACEAIMDWLKIDAPFWKAERANTRPKAWIAPRACDHLRRGRHP
jgi:molybdopterin synthase catalytic subunit